VIGTLAVDRWAVTFGTARNKEGPGWAVAPPRPLLAVRDIVVEYQKYTCKIVLME